jgi:hypothetical protein
MGEHPFAGSRGEPVPGFGVIRARENERNAPNFLYAALERTACAPFIKERRMKFREPTKLHRKSGDVGHPRPLFGGQASTDTTVTNG